MRYFVMLIMDRNSHWFTYPKRWCAQDFLIFSTHTEPRARQLCCTITQHLVQHNWSLSCNQQRGYVPRRSYQEAAGTMHARNHRKAKSSKNPQPRNFVADVPFLGTFTHSLHDGTPTCDDSFHYLVVWASVHYFQAFWFYLFRVDWNSLPLALPLTGSLGFS